MISLYITLCLEKEGDETRETCTELPSSSKPYRKHTVRQTEEGHPNFLQSHTVRSIKRWNRKTTVNSIYGLNEHEAYKL